MSFTFTDSIPASGNNPSDDQPLMLQNNVATQGILAVDHFTFNAANGGQHQWTQFPINVAFPTPPTPTDSNSVAFPAAGIADASVAQYQFQNSVGTYFLSCIKAYALCTSGGIYESQSFNVASVVRASTGVYTVTLTDNVVSGNAYAVFITSTKSASPITLVYSYAVNTMVAGQFTLNFVTALGLNAADPSFFNFIVVQV